MRIQTKKLARKLILAGFSLLLAVGPVSAGPVIRQFIGANAAAIQAGVDQFRTDLGGANNGVGGSFTSGRREINWDGVPANFSEPNNLPANFFNVNSPRGIIFNAIETDTGAALNRFAVSATAASGVAVRFGNINASYSTIFQAFSGQQLFIARNTPNLEITFFIPGTKIPATVSGFGLVFADVDSSTGGSRSLIRCYGPDGAQLSAASAGVADGGLSFVGISFSGGERVARVVIESGNIGLSATNIDGTGGVDVVAMDDFIYGEPRAMQSHSSDYDGDGETDVAIFRPGIGFWTIYLSGTDSYTTVTNFGQSGDIPVDGDFDGDAKTDIAVFRPSAGSWIIQESSTGQTVTTQFGIQGDRPVPGDYDKDGKTDLAVFRPAIGLWIIQRSSDGTVFTKSAGSTFDIPIPASPQ
jgi:hypothetical protein